MVLRNITNVGDPFVDGSGNPLAGVRIEFYLMNAKRQRVDAWDVASGELVAAGPIHVFTDNNGEFTIPLWPTSRGDQVLYWYCHVDYDGSVDFFAPLVDGVGPVQWIDFKFGGVAPDPTQYDVLTAHIADANLHFNWRGDYVHGTQYYHFDAVQSGGSTWKAKVDNVNIDPPTDSGTTSATWALMAAKGDFGTVTIGTVTTGAAGSSASVSNSGTSAEAVLDFSIPRGATGATGTAATVAVGAVTTGAPGSSASVSNSGTSGAAVLDFSIPQGAQGATGPGTGGYALVSSYASLTAAVTAIGATPLELLLDVATTLTANTTIPATLSVRGASKGTISQGAYTLAINGPFAAGDFAIFSGTGAVSGLARINLLWFGVTLGAGQSSGTRAANYTAISKAFGACAAGGTVAFPAGTVETDLPASSPTITLASNINIVGQLQESSFWYIGPDANTRSGNVMKINGGVNARFSDMSIMGPTTEHTEYDTASFNNLFWFLGTSGRLDVERCTISGGWWQIFTSNSGDIGTGIIEVKDSFLHANFQVGAIFGDGPANKSFRAIRCKFYDVGVWKTSTNEYVGYDLYIHPAVNLLLDNCDFNTYKEGVLHHYATTYSPTWGAQYINIVGTTFQNGVAGGHGCLLLSGNSTTNIDKCQFIDTYKTISYRASVNVTNSEFTRSRLYAVVAALDGVVDGATVKLDNLKFIDCSYTVAAIEAIVIVNNSGSVTSTGTNVTFIMDHLDFDFPTRITTPNYPYAIDTDASKSTVYLNNSTIRVGYLPITAITKANPAQCTLAGHGMTTGNTIKIVGVTGMTELANWTGAVTVVDANTFTLNGVDSTAYGTFSGGTMQRTAASGIQGIRIRNEKSFINNVAFNGYFLNASLLTEGAVVSSLFINNLNFNTGTSNQDISLYHSTAAVAQGGNFIFSGDVAAGYGSGTGNGAFALNRQFNPNTVSSAATVYLPMNYGTHYVSGTTQIVTLNLGRSGHIANNLFSGAEVRLIATAAWSLGNAGNIIPKNTTARAVNDVIRLIFDATAGKWIEV